MSTRIRRDNQRDTLALARLYADEDSDRGFLARQVIRLIEERAASPVSVTADQEADDE